MKKSVVGLVTVGERGQIVIPQELRKELEILPKEKLLVVRVGSYIVIEKPDEKIAERVLKALKQGLEETHYDDVEKLRKDRIGELQ